MSAWRIEEASLNAWPALQQMMFDGWMLRFSKGYTRRANSVSVIGPSQLEMGFKIDVCASRYQERGLAAMFRLSSLSESAPLDALLANRGYRRAALTSVMGLDLAHVADVGAPTGLDWREVSLDVWLAAFRQLHGRPFVHHQVMREILYRIPGEQVFATLWDGELLVCCGRGVLEDVYAGLFNVVTAPEFRNRGYGTAFVLGLLDCASDRGTQWAYLQVMEDNVPARHVYERVGFAGLYDYWYRCCDTVQGC
jgi:GNAT superfamily N-acetyltransferase